MLSRLIELEEQKLRAAAAPGLSPQSVANVMNRLRAEKDAILAEHDRTPALAAKPGGLMRFAAPLGLAAAALIAVGVLFVTLRQPTPAATLAFTLGDVKAGQTAAAAGQKLAVATPLVTEGQAFAQIGIDGFARLALAPQAEISLARLERAAGLPALEIHSRRGMLFADVDKASCSFVIETDAASIRITGTSFAVTTDATTTTVQVLEGTVQTQPSAKYLQSIADAAARERLSKVVSLSGRQKLKVESNSGRLEVSNLTPAEERVLQNYRQLVRASGDNELRTKLAREILEHEAKPQAAITPTRMTLADIRAKYGKVSRVNLVNGKSYTGFFKMRGAQIEVITPAGSVKLATADLKDVQDVPYVFRRRWGQTRP